MLQHLSQVIAVEKDDKAKASQTISSAEAKFNRPQLFSGLSRTYKPLDDAGMQLPSESTPIQLTVKSVLKEVKSHLSTLFDTTATKDWSNCQAKADIVIDDGSTLLKDVPATYLLFLEKQLVELATLVKKIPTLESNEVWHYNGAQDYYTTDAVKSIRSKKVPKSIVGHAPTREHPAQIQWFQADEPEGTWETVKSSSAIPVKEVAEISERIEKVQRAVKLARENANRLSVSHVKSGEVILGYILGGN